MQGFGAEGFRIRGSGFRLQASRFRVKGLGFRMQGPGFEVKMRVHRDGGFWSTHFGLSLRESLRSSSRERSSGSYARAISAGAHPGRVLDLGLRV